MSQTIVTEAAIENIFHRIELLLSPALDWEDGKLKPMVGNRNTSVWLIFGSCTLKEEYNTLVGWSHLC